MSSEMIFTPPLPALLPGVPDSSLSDSVIPPEMRVLAYAFQQKNGAPVSTNLLTVLTTLSVVFSRDINVESPHNGTLPLTFYALIGSGTGEGKTRVLNTVMEPLHTYESRIQEAEDLNNAQYTVDMQHWKAEEKSLRRALEKAVQEKSENTIPNIKTKLLAHAQNKPCKPIPLKKILTDVSLRGMRDALKAADGESLVLTNSDSSRFLKETLIKNAPEFCSAWSGEQLHIAKKGVEIRADNPRLSIILMVQPRMIEEFFDADHEFRISGLAARFLTFFPDPLVGKRWNIPKQPSELYQHALEDWHNKIIGQLEKSCLRREALVKSGTETIRLSPEAKQFLQNQASRLDLMLGDPRGKYFDISDIAFRIIEQSCKIAALYELFDDPQSREIRPHYVELAFNFLIEHANSYKKICSPDKPKENDLINANKILNFLSSGRHHEPYYFQNPYQPRYGIKMEVFQRCSPIRTKKVYAEPLRLLELSKKIEIVELSISIYNRVVIRKVIFVIDSSPLQEAELIQQCYTTASNSMINITVWNSFV